MTPRERILAAFNRQATDCVPVCPDFSNMIPAKMTGRPFWDMYLYKDPPMWQAYIDCANYFDIDAMLDCHLDVLTEIDGKMYGGFGEFDSCIHESIIKRTDTRIYTQRYREGGDSRVWLPSINVYYIDNPPNENVNPDKLGLPHIPPEYEDVTPKSWPQGEELLKLVKDYMGERGIVGAYCGIASLVGDEAGLLAYIEDPEPARRWRDELVDRYEKRFNVLMSFDTKPDFISTGSSGALIFQTREMFRELALPLIKNITRLCKQARIPTHLHCCGPETAVVRMCAEETDLDVIDPLEIRPMGDCDLGEIKRLYGDRLVLKGNLHTTKTMLMGTTEDVRRESLRAIEAAGESVGFILSTGDQCGRDTPFENIRVMVETARKHMY